ncbi:hypothetical protein [Pseudoalteromonas sp. 5-MNA-CIBAN-0065]|uniref:hypothetical protein n=2 Tax=Gammaproteobacteria TaxID=1236 RepID=UPI003333FBB9
MEFNDLLAQSVGQDKDKTRELPSWVSEDNASLAAYDTINSIKKEKYAYINKHKTVSKFRTNKTFQVQKSEVAKAIGATTQALFYTSSYSEELLTFLEGNEEADGTRSGGINSELMKRKDERIAKPRTGIASLSRPKVNANATAANKRIKDLEAQNAADQLALAITKLPLNVRVKLKLI